MTIEERPLPDPPLKNRAEPSVDHESDMEENLLEVVVDPVHRPMLGNGTHRLRKDLSEKTMVSILKDLGITATTGSEKNPTQTIINLSNGLILILPNESFHGYRLTAGHNLSPQASNDVLVNLHQSLAALRRITSIWAAQSESLGFALPKKHWAAFEPTPATENAPPIRSIRLT